MSASGPCPRCGAYYSTTCGQGRGWFIYGGAVYDPVAFNPESYSDFLPTPEGVRLPTSLIGFCRISVGPSPQSEGEYVQAGIDISIHLQPTVGA